MLLDVISLFEYHQAIMKAGKKEATEFLQQWHSGDRQGLDALLERHLPWIHAHVRKRMGPVLRKKAETCDYVQDAMIQFLQYGPRFIISDDDAFRALMVRIVENALRDKNDRFTAYRRNIARERPLPPDTVLSLDPPKKRVGTPSRSAERHEREAWIRLGMEFLEPEDREVLVLRQWEKRPLAEIGERFGITEKGAWMRHNRALKRLGKIIWELRSGRLAKLSEER
jgi:RNA polymerase sigma-70 factor (ECF subfamily)